MSQPLSPAEAATVARFDAAEPAPESWRGNACTCPDIGAANWKTPHDRECPALADPC